MDEIETLRLHLRPITAEYLDPLASMWNDPDIMRYLPTGEPRTFEDTRRELEYMQRHWQQYGFGVYAVTVKEHAGMAGYCGLQHLHEEPGGATAEALGETEDVEILYGLTRNLWSKGIAYEAAKATLRYGFETLKLPRIIAAMHPDNIASRRILEKLGMQEDSSIRYYGDTPHFVMYRRAFQPDNAIYAVHPYSPGPQAG